MSTLRNKVQLIGNIGNEPKITNLENGNKVVRFSMATNEYYRNAQGEKVQATQWHNVVAWNKKAAIIEQYVRKGKEIAVEGRLISRSYTNEAGDTCYITEIVASEVLLLGSKNANTPIAENSEETKKVDSIEVEETQATAAKKTQTKKRSANKKKAEKAA